MSTFITRIESSGAGPRLAVKDLIDVAGVPTTAGCRAVALAATPAAADAPCVATARAAGARIVGKVNLHELAFGATGENPWYGTPVNPLDPKLIPGGSSSGSAVAVGSGEADVAYGSDTGGSVRIPSACCGTVGLKTTWARIPLQGVWLLSESLDTVGPMAADVGGVVLGMRLLEPSFVPGSPASTVGRVRGMAGIDPAIDDAVDAALAASEFEVVDVRLEGWGDATRAAMLILLAEAWKNDRSVFERDADGIGGDVRERLELGRSIDAERVAGARATADAWRRQLAEVFTRVEVLALPTLPAPPVPVGTDALHLTSLTMPVNLGGNPALALPIPAGGPIPASLQLIGPLQGEELLVAAGAVVEGAVRG